MIGRLASVSGVDVSPEALQKLQEFASLLRDEVSRQNLVSESTLDNLWERHIVDAAQLARFAPAGSSWIDIGSGAGLPGVVIACLVTGPVTLVEPRRLRAEFLHRVCDSLQLNAEVVCSKAERVTGRYNVITARAVASLPKLFEISQHLSTGNSTWILPKGRQATKELAEAKQSWHGRFHVERSATNDESFIIVGTGVRAKA